MKNRDVAYFGLTLLAGAALAGLVVSQRTRRNYAEPYHTTKDTDGHIEVRNYGSSIAAQVELEGPRIDAIKRGFRIIAEFIFGNNLPNAKTSLPAIQQSAQKIEMTTPVMQEGGNNKWKVQFIMPQEYTLDTLPQPNNPMIAIRELPPRQMAVIRFSGSTKNNDRIAEQTARLGAYMVEHDMKPHGEPVLAFYDPPWTLPFLRRNEVMVEIDTTPKASASKKK